MVEPAEGFPGHVSVHVAIFHSSDVDASFSVFPQELYSKSWWNSTGHAHSLSLLVLPYAWYQHLWCKQPFLERRIKEKGTCWLYSTRVGATYNTDFDIYKKQEESLDCSCWSFHLNTAAVGQMVSVGRPRLGCEHSLQWWEENTKHNSLSLGKYCLILLREFISSATTWWWLTKDKENHSAAFLCLAWSHVVDLIPSPMSQTEDDFRDQFLRHLGTWLSTWKHSFERCGLFQGWNFWYHLDGPGFLKYLKVKLSHQWHL
jgi:hypothetical protein